MNKRKTILPLLLALLGCASLTGCFGFLDSFTNDKPEQQNNDSDTDEHDDDEEEHHDDDHNDDGDDDDTTILCEGISFNKETLSIVEGLNDVLKCTIRPNNATDKHITWSSTNNEVATVTQAGVVHGVKPGTAQIKATHNEGWIAKCNVTIIAAEPHIDFVETSVSLNKTSVSLNTGETETLVATLLPETLTDKTLAWNSTNPLVASVDANGKVTAISEGTATIIVSHGYFSSNCVVTVLKSPVSFENKGNVSIQNGVVTEYLSKTTGKDQYDFLKANTNLKSSDPENDNQVYVLNWEDGVTDEYRVVLSNNEDLSNPLVDKVVSVSEFNYGLYIPGETYYALVTDENSETVLANKFTINENEVRFVNVPNAKNIRDFGGWSVGTDNINYGLLYRGGCLNGKGAGKLNEEGIDIFNNDLKIETELDFRAFNSEGSGYQSQAYFDENANYITIDLKEKRFDDAIKDNTLKPVIKSYFETLANKDNYPIYMHCNEGASRTGTGAFLAEALLGVSYEDMVKDYELTNFSQSGQKRWRTHAYTDTDGFADLTNLSYADLVGTTPNDGTGRKNCGYNIDAMYVYLMENYKGQGTTIKDAVTNYVKSCGVTQETIDAFKNIMFTDGVYEEVTSRQDEEKDNSLVFVTLKGLGDDVIVPMQKGTKLDVATPVGDKKIFDAWYINETTPFDVLTTVINENITLTAHWKEYSNVPTDNVITLFELTEANAKELIGNLGKTDLSEDTIEFYEINSPKFAINLPKIRFSNYKIVEFDVMNNWKKAYLSFGSNDDDLVQFGQNITRYRYSIRIDCETGKMYVTKVVNVANSTVVSSTLTEIGYTLNENQLNGFESLRLGYSSTDSTTYGFKLTSLFTYVE